jgi:phosphate:Na+ symporter
LETYNQLKSIEDEIIDYYIQIQKFNLSETESDLTANYLIKLRSMVIAAKNIKDVIPNIKEMSQSEDGLANEVFQRLQDFALQSLNNLNQIAKQGLEQSEISKTQSEYEKFYNSTIDFLYKSIREKAPIKVSVSSITNAIKKTVSSLEELTNSAINPISENKIKLIENLKG